MNRLKFMHAPVDVALHLAAHASSGAAAIVKEAACNWAYLMYDWGFPPEVEREDWASFIQATQVYHAFGARVFAYIQTSNCVYSGSFVTKDWYAQDPRGKKIHYYTGRYMTCWESPEWIEHLGGLVSRAIESAADGIFFDNPWHGARPEFLSGTWLGPAGCYCPRCRARYRADTGTEIPKEIDPETDAGFQYLAWRAARVTSRLAELAALAKGIKPGIVISANDFDAVMRPSFITYGIDLAALAEVQDVIMIEDYGLPKWTDQPKPRLANNALTLRTARALCPNIPISIDPYDRGIGFDHVFPARRYLQSIAEASACRASAVIKATEFVDASGRFTLLTDVSYTEIRTEIGRYHRWMSARDEILRLNDGCENLSPVGLLYPSRLNREWQRLARLFFGCQQTLLAAGIPWRVVLPGQSLSHLQSLLVFDLADLQNVDLPEDLATLEIQFLPGWKSMGSGSLLHSSKLLRRIVSWAAGSIYHAYFSHKTMRGLMDGLGVMRLFTGSPFYYLPDAEARASLLDALPTNLFPRVQAEAPVLLEVWEQKGQKQFHLVNYSSQPQQVTISFGEPVSVRHLSPDQLFDTHPSGQEISFDLDIYSILVSEKN